jgi:hypothetical protein
MWTLCIIASGYFMVHLRDHAMKASPTNKLLSCSLGLNFQMMHHEVGVSVVKDKIVWT